MLIKRNIYFSAIDQETGEEKLFSTTELLTEDEYLECLYSDKDDDEELEMSKADKMSIWLDKHLTTKKDREAKIEAYDRDSQNFHKLAKQSAKRGAIIGGSVGTAAGLIMGNKKTAAALGLTGAAVSAGGHYGAIRAAGESVNNRRKRDENADKMYQSAADQAKVASGKMSKEEYIKRYGVKKKK